jgi:predicted RNase H-like HicB family nuclease
MSYIAIIDKNYNISFPDFPGVITAGTSMSDARSKAAEVLADHLDQLRAAGQRLPAPSRLDVVMADPDCQDGLAVMVEGQE